MHEYDRLIEESRMDLASLSTPDLEGATRRMKALRDYAEFELLIELAEQYLLVFSDAPELKKLYAQALIDTGQPILAANFLQATLSMLESGHKEYDDLEGILGRANKDLFLAAAAKGHVALARRHAQASFDAYHVAYCRSPATNTYQGVNAAAVLRLAADEDIDIEGSPGAQTIARGVLNSLGSGASKDPWISATRAEANVALEDWDEVETQLGVYLAHEKLTLFQIRGTLRQFRDVWRLDRRGERGEAVLALLKAGALKSGQRAVGDQYLEVGPGTQVLPEKIARASVEKVLGGDGLQTFDWMKKGFRRAESVAAMLTSAGKRIGTSFVIDPAKFGDPKLDGGQICMMTNFHVLNSEGTINAQSPYDGPAVRFEGKHDEAERSKVYPVVKILFKSPYHNGLDCTIFTIEADAATFEPIPISTGYLPRPTKEPPSRVYIIGYPLGGEMQFSLQDNLLLDHEGDPDGAPPDEDRRRVHYFAPTEPGNSGSPVFDEAWNCIALHHAGMKRDPTAGSVGMPRLNGKSGRYSANEGFWIGSIAAATAGS